MGLETPRGLGPDRRRKGFASGQHRVHFRGEQRPQLRVRELGETIRHHDRVVMAGGAEVEFSRVRAVDPRPQADPVRIGSDEDFGVGDGRIDHHGEHRPPTGAADAALHQVGDLVVIQVLAPGPYQVQRAAWLGLECVAIAQQSTQLAEKLSEIGVGMDRSEQGGIRIALGMAVEFPSLSADRDHPCGPQLSVDPGVVDLLQTLEVDRIRWGVRALAREIDLAAPQPRQRRQPGHCEDRECDHPDQRDASHSLHPHDAAHQLVDWIFLGGGPHDGVQTATPGKGSEPPKPHGAQGPERAYECGIGGGPWRQTAEFRYVPRP